MPEYYTFKPLLPFLVLCAWASRPRKARSTWSVLAGAIAVSAFVEVTAVLLGLSGKYNLWLYNLYLLAQLPLLLWVLRSLGAPESLMRFSLWLLIPHATAWCWEWGYLGLWRELFSVTALIDALFITFQYLAFLFWLSNSTTSPIGRTPVFWVGLAHVIFFGVTIPIDGLTGYLTQRDPGLASSMYVINDVLYLLFYVMLSYVFLSAKSPTSAPIQHGS